MDKIKIDGTKTTVQELVDIMNNGKYHLEGTGEPGWMIAHDI